MTTPGIEILSEHDESIVCGKGLIRGGGFAHIQWDAQWGEPLLPSLSGGLPEQPKPLRYSQSISEALLDGQRRREVINNEIQSPRSS